MGVWTKEAITTSAPRNEAPTFEDLSQAIEDRFDARYPGTEKTCRTIWGSTYKPKINHLRQFSVSADQEALCRAIEAIASASSRIRQPRGWQLWPTSSEDF
jgi:hypothetical protein